MTDGELTPSVAQARDAYCAGSNIRRETIGQHYRGDPIPDYGAEFDRMLADVRAAAWAEACSALAWAIDNGTVEDAMDYVARHNPHRPYADTPALLEQDGPAAGHLFELSVRCRGSLGLIGDSGRIESYTEDKQWGPLVFVTKVRAWDLPAALLAAVSVPLAEWEQNRNTNREDPS